MQKYLLLLVVLLSNSCFAQTNFNGSFEKINSKTNEPEGWRYGFNKAQELAYPPKLDSIIKKEGRYSVSIAKKSKEADFGVIEFIVPNRFKGNAIELAGYMKTEAVANGFAGLWLRLDDEDGNVVKFDNMQTQAIAGTNDWKQYTIKLAYDDNVKSIHLGGLIVGDGKAWFDDLQLSIDGKKIQNLKPLTLTAAETDTEFSKGSKIENFIPNNQQISNIVIAGQFWGFLKYHHPAVAKGNYNWDAELFRLLPSVISAKNNVALSKALEQYLDKLPKVEVCKSCDPLNPASELKPNYGELLSGTILSKTLTEKIDFILKNTNNKYNYYISMQAVGNPKFLHEKPYASMQYPDAGYRILSLFRYWNMVNYFFPYKDVIGEDWNKVLAELAPEFIRAENQNQYVIAVLKMVAKINDTHAYLTGLNTVMDNLRGKNTTPFRAKFVEEKLVVYDYFNTADSIKNSYKIGDEIVSINGEKVSDLIKKYSPLVAASNYETKLRNLPLGFLLRSNNKDMQLDINRGGIVIQRKCALINYNSTYSIKTPSINAYKIIDENIGYVYPGSYKNSDLPAIKKLFENTKGMVIDMRCYPTDFMPFIFGEYIKKDKTPFVKFTVGNSTKPGTFVFGKESISNGGNKNAYEGKIIVIVDETSQSNAEYTTMAFQSSPNVKVIGSKTAGADGNVSTIVLPGGASSWISGIGVFYPDGTPTQRVGVKIDYPIKPTIKGITDGKDELLEKAISLLRKGW